MYYEEYFIPVDIFFLFEFWDLDVPLRGHRYVRGDSQAQTDGEGVQGQLADDLRGGE